MNIRLRIKTSLGAETVAAAGVVKVGIKAVAITANVAFESGARETGAVGLAGRTCNRLEPRDHGL